MVVFSCVLQNDFLHEDSSTKLRVHAARLVRCMGCAGDHGLHPHLLHGGLCALWLPCTVISGAGPHLHLASATADSSADACPRKEL